MICLFYLETRFSQIALLIPKKEDRIKIASYFQTDSGNIWMPEEIVKFELEEEKKKLEAKNGE